MIPTEPFRFLSPDEMETIHRNALRILAEIGMRIDHDVALDHLAAAGCTVDRNARLVHFPPEVVQASVDRMRAAYAERSEPEHMAVRYSHVRFRSEPFQVHQDFTVNTGGYCVYIYDLEGRRRPATLQDTRDALKLVEQLPNITHSGLPVAAQDVPLPIRQVAMAAELVKGTSKLGGIEALSPFDIEYICRIGEVVRGGPEELRRRPILVGYGEAKTPLEIDYNMCEIFLEYIRRGMPQSLDTMPNAGATAPIHPAGTLALGVAETLGGLTLAYAAAPDAVVTIDVTPGFSDMATGIFRYSGAERVALLGSRIQMISEFYGCPSGVHGGKTDSCLQDVRCGVEKGISMLAPVLCGAVGFGTVGHIENAVTFSPVQLVMDDQIAGYVRRVVKGFDVTDETVGFDLIQRVGIGGNYLAEPDTAERFRDLVHLSPFFTAAPWGGNTSPDESRRWERMAHDRTAELMASEIEPPLSPDQIRDVDAVVAEAEARLREDGRIS
ncbi:MAG: trimethylamine methyltransferase family protein [Planctomycetes bacterium]|nr:trimethylamine methyltransferase family protein [Planctomycetota bacterium]